VFGSKRKKAEALFANGSKGVGVLLSVQDTGVTMNDNPRVKMVFRVEPIDGSGAFEAQKTATVSRVQIPRPGDRYPVWYDPTDHDSFAYATVATDEGRDQIRALFGAAADTITGVGDPSGGASAGAAVATAPPPASAPASDPIEQIKKLGELRSAGILTDAEFEEKKAQLLAQL
jgi:hypothetical protein